MHTLALQFPTAPLLLTKDSKNEISYDFQPPFSLHTSNSRTKPMSLSNKIWVVYHHEFLEKDTAQRVPGVL